MAEELVNAEQHPAPPAVGSTSLITRSAVLNDPQWADRYAQREAGGQGNTLRQWTRLLYRHKLLIVSLLLLVVPFVTIQAYRPKPVYEAMATIEVRLEDGGVLKNLDSSYSWRAYDNTKAEMYILKSRPVLKQVLNRLALDKNPLFLESLRQRSVTEAIRALSGANIEQAKKAAQEKLAPQPENQLQGIEQAPPPGAELAETAEERDRIAPYLAMLASGLKVEPVKDTRLLKITFTHADPEIAAQVANTTAQSFIEYNYATKTKRFTDTTGYLEETTRKLKARVEEAEAKLADYTRTHGLYTTDGKENLATNKLAEMHALVMKAETDRILKEGLYEQVKQGRLKELPQAFEDAKTAELRKELNDLAVAHAQISVRFGAKHPRLQELRQQMAVITEQINSNELLLEGKLKADYERAVREEESLRAALNTAKSEATQQNQANIEFSILQQDLVAAKANYADIINKTTQASIQRMEQYNNVLLVEKAEAPRGPIGPRRYTMILAGVIGSLLAGIGLAWLMENLNTSVRNMEDLARIVPLPVLAMIPTLDRRTLGGQEVDEESLLPPASDGDASLVHTSSLAQSFLNDEYSTAAEAYRMLRTSVLLSTADHPPRTILVTSGQPGDGKTTTIFNTALAFTQLKSEVLIIDCDLRKPRLHKVAQVEKGRGLSNFLSSGGDLTELIRPTSIPHLSILPSGPVPPNPSELISSNKMKELLVLLQEVYDYILIDSPPLVTVTDPIILSTLVDGVILVAKSGKTKTDVLRRAYHDLATINAKILGVVLNDFNMRRDGYQDYYYYYRYQYDYRETA